MDIGKNHINYTSEDFKRYYSGTMTAAERHALEKAALDDPFLADALEGYKYSTPGDVQHLKIAIKDRIKRKDGNVRLFRLPWLRIAAMLVVLVGAGWLVYRFAIPSKNDLAISNEVQTNPDLPKSKEHAIPEANEVFIADSTTAIQNKSDDLLTNSNKNKLENSVSKTRTDPISKPSKSVKQELNYDLPENNLNKQNKSILLSAPASATAPITQNTYHGKVIDESGNAIPYATISTPDNRATITDISGNFSIVIPDTTFSANISAPGYFTRELALNNNKAETTIILQNNHAALSEVVVTREANARKKQAAKMITEEGYLEPTEGWVRFNDYISENIRLPEEMGEEPIRGEVTLAFDIDSKGEPVNITVQKSLCSKCDEEAIRLLKQGPKWKKKANKKGVLSIMF